VAELIIATAGTTPSAEEKNTSEGELPAIFSAIAAGMKTHRR
jgi:hypothetical protein